MLAIIIVFNELLFTCMNNLDATETVTAGLLPVIFASSEVGIVLGEWLP